MVKTRSGKKVVHTVGSYGRAFNEESKRRQRKRKAERGSIGDGGGATTPRKTVTRAHAQQEESLVTPPSMSRVVAPTPPPKTLRPRLRGSKPRCSDYGPSRRYVFQGQGFFFCHNCDLWDALTPDASKNVSGDSRTYGCTANHESFSHPTTFRSDYSLRLCGASKVADMEKDDDDSSQTDFDSDEDYECDGKSSDDDHDSIGDDGSATDDNVNLLLTPASPCANNGTVPAFSSAVTPLPVSPSKQIQDARNAIAGYEREVTKLKHEVTVLQRKNRYLTRENDNSRRSNNGNESGNE